MKFNQIILIMAIALISNLGMAQAPSYQDDGIGKPIGKDVSLQMFNYISGKAKISDFKSKLLIIDFWATWCSPCRGFLKTADSLEKQFGDKIMVLPVTYEDSLTVVGYLNSFKTATGINVTSAINDMWLNQMFDHNIIPHEVWINPGDQKVIAITDAGQVNATNIEKVLNNEPVDWKMKIDYAKINVDYDNKPVLINGSQGVNIPDSIVLRNVSNHGYDFKLTRFIPGLASVSVIGNPYVLKGFNQFPINLYRDAIYDQRDINTMNTGHISVNVKDTSFFIFPEHAKYWTRQSWISKNNYCYELILKDTTLNKSDIALKEFNAYFKQLNIIGVRIEKQVPCYLLKRTSNIDKLTTKGGKKSENLHNPYQMSIRNNALSDWVDQLKMYWLQNELPIYDESGFGDKLVDMDLICNMKSIISINQALAKYDLKLEKSEKKLKSLEIKNIH